MIACARLIWPGTRHGHCHVGIGPLPYISIPGAPTVPKPSLSIPHPSGHLAYAIYHIVHPSHAILTIPLAMCSPKRHPFHSMHAPPMREASSLLLLLLLLLLPLHAPHHSHAAIAQPTCGRTLPRSRVGIVVLVVRPAPGVFPLFPPKRQQRWRSGRRRAWTCRERHARLPEAVTAAAPAAPAAHVQLKQNTHHTQAHTVRGGSGRTRPRMHAVGVWATVPGSGRTKNSARPVLPACECRYNHP